MTSNQKLFRFFISLIYPKKRRSLRPLYLLFKVALVFVVFVFVINLFSIGRSSFGEWGDFFGGVLNPLLTFLTFMGLLVTIVIQQTELRESRVELRRSADALTAQTVGFQKQTFESTFFNMLSIHNGIVNSIDLNLKDGHVMHGRDCFSVFYTRLTKLYRQNQKDAKGKYDDSAVLRLAYQLFWKNHQAELGHYFRYLFNVIRFVDQSGFSDGPYIRLIRAQLSDQELLLLFYNCIGGNGGNFTEFVEKYAILDNMPRFKILEPSHLKRIHESAFGKIEVVPLFNKDGKVFAWLYEDSILRSDGSVSAVIFNSFVYSTWGVVRGSFIEGLLRDNDGRLIGFAIGADGKMDFPATEEVPNSPLPGRPPVPNVPSESNSLAEPLQEWSSVDWAGWAERSAKR